MPRSRSPVASVGPALLVAWAILSCVGAARADDPYLRWHTVRTPNFRVHYHGGLAEVAQRTATLAEEINQRLYPDLAWRPSQVTHIRLSDGSDSANGSATALPFNTITLLVTAPDDMSPLGDYDDWLLELLTHEHTHILHVDNITGIPALLNAIVGKTFVPNQIQPRWLLEGLAVVMESEHTSGGRLRSSLFDMYLRADTLESNLARLDQMSHAVRRWPGANIWYLYGGRFLGWIADVYGPQIFADVSSSYGTNIIPWGINRAIRRATGRTYPELYRGWVRHLERHYRAQAAAVRRRGLREGVQLTHAGQFAGPPRWVPRCARRSDRPELMYFRDDGHSLPGFYRVELPVEDRGETRSRFAIRANGELPNVAFTPDCGVVYPTVAPSKRRHYYNDLHYLPPGVSMPGSLLGTGERWTTGLRARDPDVSPDGRLLVFVTNHAGTSTLRLADIEPSKGIARVRALVPSARFEQAYNPRFSPDGQHVAYSVWTKGGFRDVRIVEVATGTFIEIGHDRPLDMQPTWSPDGKRVFFASDRTGIANIYAYDIDAGTVRQVTNVINGAYMPEVSPDGRTLYYVGYTHAGFDLFGMSLDPGEWMDALPAAPDHPERPKDPAAQRWPVEPYDPFPTLRPRALDFEYGPGTFGQAFTLRVAGSDIVGWNSLSASTTVQTELDTLTGSLGYTYSRLPVFLRMELFRDVVPRNPVVVGGREQARREQLTGLTTGMSYDMPGPFDGQSASLSYSITRRAPTLEFGRSLDPVSPVPRGGAGQRPEFVFDGVLASLRLGWSYNNSFASLYHVSPERGLSISLGSDFAGKEIGSDDTLASFDGRMIGYIPMPWLRHHVLAMSISGGASTGSFTSRGYFFTGGFADTDPIEDFRSGIRQSGFVLRGYAPNAFRGRLFSLYNAEYRFPIWHPERGVSTLPAFFRTLHAAAFMDYGGAFDGIDREDPLAVYHLGVGGELRALITLGYFVEGTVRFGVARGLDDEALEGVQTYVVVASGF